VWWGAEAMRRVMFIVYLAGVLAGLAWFITAGLMRL
jgi:hypothetical protein